MKTNALCSFGPDVFPMCMLLDDIDTAVMLKKLGFAQKVRLYLLGRVVLPDAIPPKGTSYAIYLCKDWKGLYFSYPQGFYDELRRWDADDYASSSHSTVGGKLGAAILPSSGNKNILGPKQAPARNEMNV